MATLWHSSLPCFDTVNMTAARNGERAMIKSCTWKGYEVPCSAIFQKTPTDIGLCCAFNAKAADQIFTGDGIHMTSYVHRLFSCTYLGR
jgi:hypothetical protein